MFREDAQKYAAKSLAEVQERRKAINRELKDGERRIVIQPGFDLRGTADSNYGQSTPTIIFMERRGNTYHTANITTLAEATDICAAAKRIVDGRAK